MTLLALSATLAAAAAAGGAGTAAPTAALLVVDIQNFYFEGGRVPLVAPEPAAANARRLLDAFRAGLGPVIHVQHLPPGQSEPTPASGDEQYRIRAVVAPRPGETVIGKHHANAFRDTDLLDRLRQRGVTALVICGMQTHMCVEAAARAAADLGFDVTVVADACATRDLSYAGVDVPAREVHAAVLAALAGTYAKVVTTDAFLGPPNESPEGGEGAAER